VRTAAAVLAVALVAGVAAEGSASAELVASRTPKLAVMSAVVDGELRPLAHGLGEWPRQQLGAGSVLAQGDALATRIEALRNDLTRTQAASESASGCSGQPLGSRYEILDESGRGGMGVVYRARDRQLGRVVALKVLPESLRDHPVVLELFEREARAAAALNHPNIVTVYDAGRGADTAFISMECLDGAGLDRLFRKQGKLPARGVASLGIQASRGLEYARRPRGRW
jgi:hypothetical protein